MKKYRTITIHIDINKSKEVVWDMLFNRFGETILYNTLIVDSTATNDLQGEVGAERKCDLDAKNSVVEKIVARRESDGFDIDIIEGGMPMMEEMKANYDLYAINGNQTKVTLTMKFITKPAFLGLLMKGKMAKMLRKMLVGLKYHLETKQVVTKSTIENIMKGFKNLKKGEGFQTKELALA